jgi:hypothetical protein
MLKAKLNPKSYYTDEKNLFPLGEDETLYVTHHVICWWFFKLFACLCFDMESVYARLFGDIPLK